MPSRFPPIPIFESLVEPDELDVLLAIEALTDDRLQAEAGGLYRLPKDEWVTGPGASVVMAAFTHLGAVSRFGDGSYGVYYAGLDEETAISETVFHTARRLGDTDEPAIDVDMRCYVGTVRQALEDIRGAAYGRLQDPALESWTICQAFGRTRREAGAWGLYCRSARQAGGECVAAFRPRAVSIPTRGARYRYCWNGHAIERVLTVSDIREL